MDELWLGGPEPGGCCECCEEPLTFARGTGVGLESRGKDDGGASGGGGRAGTGVAAAAAVARIVVLGVGGGGGGGLGSGVEATGLGTSSDSERSNCGSAVLAGEELKACSASIASKKETESAGDEAVKLGCVCGDVGDGDDGDCQFSVVEFCCLGGMLTATVGAAAVGPEPTFAIARCERRWRTRLRCSALPSSSGSSVPEDVVVIACKSVSSRLSPAASSTLLPCSFSGARSVRDEVP